MAIAKVILNGETLMDVTSDTVTASNTLSGVKATKNDGTKVTGNIASKSSTDLTVSGATVTAPAGYYANAASKAVATATHPNPTATIASSTGVVTASHTQGTGYVTGGTTTGTLSLTTQAGKTITPTESAQTAVASYRWTTGPVSVAAISSTYVGTGVTTRSAADMTVAGQSVTAPAGYYSQAFTKAVTTTTHPNPTAAIVSSTGVVTATHTQGTGYVTGGTTTGTLNLTTQGATTYNTSTADQTIASNRWLTGTQTIKSVTTSNLTAANIAEGVVVKVGDANNASRITQITGTYSGAVKHTATITSAGADNWDYGIICEVIYNGTRYYTSGSTFEFSEGDSLRCCLLRVNPSDEVSVSINDEQIYTDSGRSSASPYDYYYTLPTYDIEIALTTNGSAIDITLPELSITENGKYNVCDYGYADVNVQQGYTVDDIALRSMSGAIGGTTSQIRPYAFCYCSNITEIDFPNVTAIKNGAFQDCYKLSSVNLPKLTSANASAFANCSSLASINLPLLTAISDHLFYSCSNLLTVSCTSASRIWSQAFYLCSKLTTISFPNVDYIAEGAFSECRGLVSINFPQVVSVASSAFYDCYSLTTINFPLVQSFYSYVFYRCHSLINISCPSLKTIGMYAFANCDALSTISLPAISSIGGQAFSRCYNLLSLYLLGSSIPTLAAANAFSSTPISNYTTSTGGVYGSIFVPASLYNSYITATNWSYFSSRFVSV